MPIVHRTGSIFEQEDVNVILHQANIFCTMGERTSGGIAALIEKYYPEAADADGCTKKGDKNKIGTYSFGKGADGKIILNCYSQVGMGAFEGNTSYDAIVKIFRKVETNVATKNPNMVLAVPYGYGSAMAGGRWPIVEAIFHSIFDDSPVKLVIVKLPTQKELK